MYQLNENLLIESFFVGYEKQKILVIDNVLQNAREMVDFTLSRKFIADTTHYPGVKLPAPDAYAQSLVRVLGPILAREYHIDAGCNMETSPSMFSLMTTKEEDLSVFQCFPHCDTAYYYQFAILLYLCDADHGGTAFFRHNSTGYEVIADARRTEYEKAYFNDIEQYGEPVRRYFNQSDSRYTNMASVHACFNRMLIYRSCLLHSAYIDPKKSIDPNPGTGRLTLNSFMAFYKKI